MPLQARVLSDRYPVSDLKVTQKNLGYDERRFVCFLLAKNLADTSRIANSWQHPIENTRPKIGAIIHFLHVSLLHGPG